MAVTDAAPRSARAERTRIAIADALLSLLDEGELQPTANRIAERAGISLRLIYHHFGDLEALFREAAEREGVRLLNQVRAIPTDLPFDDRLDAFVEQRASLLEWMTPVCRAAALHSATSEALTDARHHATAAGDHELRHVFAAEIEALDEPARSELVDALCALTSWPAWNDLRVRGRSQAACQATMRAAVVALLRPGA